MIRQLGSMTTNYFLENTVENISKQSIQKDPAACSGVGRKSRLAVFTLVVFMAGSLTGGAVAVGTDAFALNGDSFSRHDRHPKGDHRWAESVEEAQGRARDRAAWVLGRLDAGSEQKDQIYAILDTLVEKLYPLKQFGLEVRRDLITELSRPQLDQTALQSLRADIMAMADSASAELVVAVTAASDVLTVEQRLQIATHLARHKH